MTNSDAYSNTNVIVTVPALGDVRIDQGTSGTGIDRMDDVTPNVWEEAYAVGLGSGINTVTGTSNGSTIEYTPNMLPDGLTGRIAYSPDVGGNNAADKTSTSTNTPEDSGYDLTLEATSDITGIDGLTLYAGISRVTQDSSVSGYSGDQEEDTFAFSYAIGGFTVGYQWSEEDLGTSSNEKQYENDAYGITFAVNDDLSIGYNHYESVQVSATNTTAEASSIQIAYSMGGASIRLAEGSTDNASYQTGAGYDNDATLLSVSLAF
jgi:outer membrane protein OmpU